MLVRAATWVTLHPNKPVPLFRGSILFRIGTEKQMNKKQKFQLMNDQPRSDAAIPEKKNPTFSSTEKTKSAESLSNWREHQFYMEHPKS